MSRARLLVGLLLGAPVVALLLSLLPADVFASTRAFLLVVASAVLLLVAAALFLLPARRALAAAFGLPLALDGPALGLPPETELRTVLSPLVVAATCLGVVLVAQMMR